MNGYYKFKKKKKKKKEEEEKCWFWNGAQNMLKFGLGRYLIFLLKHIEDQWSHNKL